MLVKQSEVLKSLASTFKRDTKDGLKVSTLEHISSTPCAEAENV